jgi:hypothetical protein
MRDIFLKNANLEVQDFALLDGIDKVILSGFQ